MSLNKPAFIAQWSKVEKGSDGKIDPRHSKSAQNSNEHEYIEQNIFSVCTE